MTDPQLGYRDTLFALKALCGTQVRISLGPKGKRRTPLWVDGYLQEPPTEGDPHAEGIFLITADSEGSQRVAIIDLGGHFESAGYVDAFGSSGLLIDLGAGLQLAVARESVAE